MSLSAKAKIIEDIDSESGFSLIFPEGFIEQLGWEEGDLVKWETIDSDIILTKIEK